ncbi:MAG: serine hydrolase [Gammaproteobacteria bacterium]|nr:serine hydrolase [Gammaproteobacteria bacterium]
MRDRHDQQPLRHRTTLGNWRQAPYNAWAFHNVQRLLPTAPVRAATRPWPLPRRMRSLDRIPITTRTAGTEPLGQALRSMHTDAFIVLHRGCILEERYFNGMQPDSPHILMSVSKSLTAAVAGVLIDDGRLDPHRSIGSIIPALEASGYANARLQDLLDMRLDLDFEEDYQASEGPMIHYRVAGGWNPDPTPADPGRSPAGLHAFIAGLRQSGAHGGIFKYTSPNTDLLGWLLEQVGGASFSALLETHIWQPMGAEHAALVTLDRVGAARTAGGINVSLRDLARIGQMMLNNGLANERQVLPSWWVDDTRHAGDADAWRAGKFAQLLPEGRYRNQWYQYGNEREAVCGIGIHGQILYLAPGADVVIAHLGSHPQPFDEAHIVRLLDGMDSLAATIVDGGAGVPAP